MTITINTAKEVFEALEGVCVLSRSDKAFIESSLKEKGYFIYKKGRKTYEFLTPEYIAYTDYMREVEAEVKENKAVYADAVERAIFGGDEAYNNYFSETWAEMCDSIEMSDFDAVYKAIADAYKDYKALEEYEIV